MKRRKGLGGNPMTTICHFHNHGGCSNESCTYQHPNPPLDSEGELIVCRHDRYGQDKCWIDNCIFRHPSREEEVEITDLRDVLSRSASGSERNSNRIVVTTPTEGSAEGRREIQISGSPKSHLAASTPQHQQSSSRDSLPLPSTSPVLKRRASSKENNSSGPKKIKSEVDFKNQDFEFKYRELQYTNTALEARLKNKDRELDAEKIKVNGLTSTQDRLLSEAKKARLERDEEKKKLENRNSEIATLKNKINEMKNSHSNQLKTMQEVLDGKEEKEKCLESEINKLKEVTEKLKCLETEINNFKEITEKQTENFQKELREKEHENADLKKEKEEFKETAEKLQRELRENKLENTDLKKEKDESKEQTERLQRELRENKLENDNLKKEKDELKKNITSLETFNSSVKNQMHRQGLDDKKRIAKLELEVKQLKTSLNKVGFEKNNFRREATELQTNLSKLENERNILKKETDKEINLLKRDLSDAKETEAKSKERYETLNADFKNLQSDIEVFNKEREELQESLMKRFEVEAKLNGEKEELNKNLISMEEERDNLDEENTNLTEKMKNLENKLLQSDVNCNRNYDNKSDHQEVTTEEEIKAIKAELEDVKKQRDGMRIILKTNQRRLEEKSKSLELMKGELKQKEETIKHNEEFILPFVRKFYESQEGQHGI